MDPQLSGTAPDAQSVLRYVSSRLRASKWLIAGAAVIIVLVILAATRTGSTQIWTGRTIMTIGIAPATGYLTQGTGPGITMLESPRRTIARLSDPAFRLRAANRAGFEPATAEASRSMVISSLRGVPMEEERDVAVELSAASAADVRSAFRAVADEIGDAHNAIFNRQLHVMQLKIDDEKSRISEVEKETDELNERIFNSANKLPNPSGLMVTAPALAASIPAWNQLRSLIQQDTALKELSEPSSLPFDPTVNSSEFRSVAPLRNSLLLGAALLVAIIILTIVISPPKRPN